MYDYPQYKENDREKLISFMREHPFATIIGADKTGRVELTQIPVMIKEEGDELILTGHIVRKSAHHKAFVENPEVW